MSQTIISRPAEKVNPSSPPKHNHFFQDAVAEAVLWFCHDAACRQQEEHRKETGQMRPLSGFETSISEVYHGLLIEGSEITAAVKLLCGDVDSNSPPALGVGFSEEAGAVVLWLNSEAGAL